MPQMNGFEVAKQVYKDEFIDNSISERKIEIKIFSDNHSKTIEVSDNAGGIPENIIENIFNANFTTKNEDKGTGIGLYLSNQIATKYISYRVES